MKASTSSNLVTEMVGKWARKRFAHNTTDAFVNADHFKLEQETRSEGYCETCWSEYAAVVLYAVDKEGRETEIYVESYADLMDILNEVLEASQD